MRIAAGADQRNRNRVGAAMDQRDLRSKGCSDTGGGVCDNAICGRGRSMKRAVHRIIGPSGDRLIRRALDIALATLREIFDESAYERFLSRTQTVRSVASYREFLREREATIVRKPRCC